MGNETRYQQATFDFCRDSRNFYYLRFLEQAEIRSDQLNGIDEFVRSGGAAEVLPSLIEFAYGIRLSPKIVAQVAGFPRAFSLADAILVSSVEQALVTRFFFRHHKAQRPTRIFADIFEALDWMQEQREAHSRQAS